MQHGTRSGRIEVIAGVMFSGKSEELIRRVRRAVIARKRVQVFKSHLDARYAGLYSVSTHDGGTVEAEPVDCSEEIMSRWRPETEVLAVDEVQFLDDGIVAVANTLADRGVRVVLAGIDMDVRGLPFGPVPTLLAVAEVVDKLQAIARPGGDVHRRRRADPTGAGAGGGSTRRDRSAFRIGRPGAGRLARPRGAALEGDGRSGRARRPQRDRPPRRATAPRRAGPRGARAGRRPRRERHPTALRGTGPRAVRPRGARGGRRAATRTRLRAM